MPVMAETKADAEAAFDAFLEGSRTPVRTAPTLRCGSTAARLERFFHAASRNWLRRP